MFCCSRALWTEILLIHSFNVVTVDRIQVYTYLLNTLVRYGQIFKEKLFFAKDLLLNTKTVIKSL